MTNATNLAIESEETVVHLTNGMSLRSGSTTRQSGDYVSLCYADGSQRSRWVSSQWRDDPTGVMAAIMAAAADTDIALVNKEVVVKLACGATLRSGVYESRCGGPAAGEYVCICEANGEEYAYWDCREWTDDPELVMGAIISAC